MSLVPPGHGESVGPATPMPRCPHCATVIDTVLAAGTGEGMGRCTEHGLVRAAYVAREVVLAHSMRCPECGSADVRKATAYWQCMTCSHDWIVFACDPDESGGQR